MSIKLKKNIYKIILNHEAFKTKPIVCLDIGASGSISKDWKYLSKYSICIAFDADKRDINYLESETRDWYKLYVINKILIDFPQNTHDFYLTGSPHCSSVLSPELDKLKDWSFYSQFKVVNTVRIESVTLKEVLKSLNIDQIDWYKSDSQGIDLRLFKSLEEKINNISYAEFEPGIIDAYTNEDKLYDLMNYLSTLPFWISEMNIHGSQRIDQKILNDYLSKLQKKYIKYFIKSSPGWANITYIHDSDISYIENNRNALLLCLVSLIKKQWGFGLTLTEKAYLLTQDPIYLTIKRFFLYKINSQYYKLIIHFLQRILIRILSLNFFK